MPFASASSLPMPYDIGIIYFPTGALLYSPLEKWCMLEPWNRVQGRALGKGNMPTAKPSQQDWLLPCQER